METVNGTLLSEFVSTSWVVGIGICVALSVALILFDRTIGQYSKWFVLFGAAVPFLTTVLVFVNRFETQDKQILGWIWPKNEVGSIHVGLGTDLFTYGLIAVISVVVVLRAFSFTLDKYIASALLMGIAGFAICWSSKTFGLATVGLAVSILAGGMALVGAYEDENDTHWIVQYLKRNMIGLGLTEVGGCGLLSQGGALDFTKGDLTKWDIHTGEVGFIVSIIFILLGLFLIIVPLTVQSSLSKQTKLKSIDYVFFVVIFPVISALAILQRLHPHLLETQSLNIFGFVCLGLLLVMQIPLYLKTDLRSSFDHFCSLFPTVILIALCFSGPWAAYILTLSFVVFSLCVAFLLGSPKSRWSSTILAISIYGWMGGIGFSSVSGYLSTYNQPEEQLSWAVGISFVIFLLQIQGWRILFSYLRLSDGEPVRWWKLLVLQTVLLVPFGVFYTGTFSGGALHPAVDDVSSFLEIPWVRFYKEFLDVSHPEQYVIASAIHWSSFIFSALLGFLTLPKTGDRMESLKSRFSKTKSWADAGFGLDTAHHYFLRNLEKLGFHLKETLSKTAWEKVFPAVFQATFSTLRTSGSKVDSISNCLSSEKIRVILDAPSKLVQLSQNGDLQWYLFFGVVWTLVVLVHFIQF